MKLFALSDMMAKDTPQCGKSVADRPDTSVVKRTDFRPIRARILYVLT